MLLNSGASKKRKGYLALIARLGRSLARSRCYCSFKAQLYPM